MLGWLARDLVVDLEQRRQRDDGRGRFTRQPFELQLLRQRERKVAACRVAREDDLVGVVALQPQPLVGVVAVVERHADGVLGDHPVVDDQHRAVGEVRQGLDQASVAVHAAGQKRAAVHVENDAAFAVGRKHARRADQLGVAVRKRDRGPDRARSRLQHAAGEVHNPERPRHPRCVAADSQSWPDSEHCGQRKQPAAEARTVLDDLYGCAVTDREFPRFVPFSCTDGSITGAGNLTWCRHRHHFLRSCNALGGALLGQPR